MYIFQNYHDIHIIFFGSELPDPGPACLPRPEDSSDWHPARFHAMLHGITTDENQRLPGECYYGIHSLENTKRKNDMEAWGSGNGLWHCPSAASEQQARRGNRGGFPSQQEMQVPSLFGSNHSVAGAHGSVAPPKFLQALRVGEPMLLSLRDKKWRNHTGQLLGFWKKTGSCLGNCTKAFWQDGGCHAFRPPCGTYGQGHCALYFPPQRLNGQEGQEDKGTTYSSNFILFYFVDKYFKWVSKSVRYHRT